MRFHVLATPEQRKWRCSWCDPSIDPEDPGDRNKQDPELRRSDKSKREDRNCDGNGRKLTIDWAPDIDRCPKRYVCDPHVATVLDWWTDWKLGMGLPYGSMQALDEPCFVYEGIRCCEQASQRANGEAVKHG